MAEAFKRLGAVSPAATTATAIYVVPAATSATVSTVNVCNRAASATSFRLAHCNGAVGTLADEDYIYYDLPLNANDTFQATLGITMATGDTLVAYCADATVSFIAWGCEIT